MSTGTLRISCAGWPAHAGHLPFYALRTLNRYFSTSHERTFEDAVTTEQPTASPSAEPGVSTRWVPGLALRRYGTDLTELARRGQLDPVIGRQDIVERMLQILLRRTKNNAVVVGEAGVGKTAIVEGIAQLITSAQVPASLRDKHIVSLDVTALVAGSAYRGEFEDRLQHVVRDVEAQQGRIILFIDEIHMLVGAGAAKGGLDAANMLKPALARGRLRCIGATTLKEYRAHIESDAALARRFQAVLVEEPSPEAALACLRGLRLRYEAHHAVHFTDGALRAAVSGAHRFISDRKLPDSALDLVDEAASRVVLRAAAAVQLPQLASLQAPTAKLSPQPLATTEDAMPVLGRAASCSGSSRAHPLSGGGAAPLQLGWSQTVGAGAEGRISLRLAMELEERDLAIPRSCPHCGTQVLASRGELRLRCRNCTTQFLALSPEKLQLAATVLSALPTGRHVHGGHTAGNVMAAGGGSSSSTTTTTTSIFHGDGLTSTSDGAGGSCASSRGPASAATCSVSSEQACKTPCGGAQSAAAAAVVPPSVQSPGRMLPQTPIVTEADVLEVVSQSTGIPAARLNAQAAAHLLDCEAQLLKTVVGQRAAVAAVAAAIKLWRTGLNRRTRPLASCVLLAPPGVGGTTICKALAKSLFEDHDSLFQLNMSEFREPHTISKLLGAPPGYAGHGAGGLLTEAVRRRPHRLIIFRDADRAHPEVLELLSRIVADGQLTDGSGTTVSFRSTVLVFTIQPRDNSTQTGRSSDVTSQLAPMPIPLPGVAHAASHPASPGAPAAAVSAGLATAGSSRQGSMAAMSELCSHVDAVIPLQPLSREDIDQVVGNHLDGLQQEFGIHVDADHEARTWLAARGHTVQHGLRPLSAVVRQHVLAPFADAVLRQTALMAAAGNNALAESAGLRTWNSADGFTARVRCSPDRTCLNVVVEALE